MTAEIAIMNREAIALAADSAVTFQQEKGQKIFTSASKIFTLSKYQPVGVMINGSANLMGVPWETIIKVYRNNLGQKSFKTIGEYAHDFLSFVGKTKQIFSEEDQKQYVENSIYSCYQYLEENINKDLNKIIKAEGEINNASITDITSQIIKAHFDEWQNAKLIPSVPVEFRDTFKEKYEKIINSAKKKVFGNVSLTSESLSQLTDIIVNLFIKYPTGVVGSDSSGIVFAGFGTENIFPALEHYAISGKIGDYLKYEKIEEDSTEMNLQTGATIKSFAQGDMVSTFMTGVDPNYQKEIDKVMKDIYSSYPQVILDHFDFQDEGKKEALKQRLDKYGQEKFNEHREKLEYYRIDNYINPVMTVVQGLPKDELAAMAETLISLTSFKKRVSMEQETVADPIDVAVISKGDGFIWIKRKHYFDSELNQHFFANYYKEVDTNDTKTTEKAY